MINTEEKTNEGSESIASGNDTDNVLNGVDRDEELGDSLPCNSEILADLKISVCESLAVIRPSCVKMQAFYCNGP